MAGKSQNLGNIYVGIRGRLDKFKADLRKARGESKTASKGMQRTFDKVNFNKARTSLLSFNRLLVAGFAGYGIKTIASSFIDAANTTEQYRLRLNALLGDTKEGGRVFEEMAKFAGEVPYEFEQIMSAATQLSGVMRGGVDEIKQWMPLIADLAAVSGLGIQQTTEQVIRMYSAGAASADLFRERGITAMLGFSAGVSYSAEETRKRLMQAWLDPASKFRDATKELAKTWSGTMSMISDKWFKFRNLIMEAGAYDELKSGLGEINEKFGEWIENNEKLIAQKVPEYIGNIHGAINRIVNIYDKFPKEVVGAAGVGILGRILLGGSGPAKVLAKILALGYLGEETALKFELYSEEDVKRMEAIQKKRFGSMWIRIVDYINKKTSEKPTPPMSMDEAISWVDTDKRQKAFLREAAKLEGVKSTTPMAIGPTKEEIKAEKKRFKEYTERVNRYVKIRKEDLEMLGVGLWDPAETEYDRKANELKARGVMQAKELAEEKLAITTQAENALIEKEKETFSAMTELSERTAWAMQENFSAFFFSAMKGELTSLKDFATSIFDSILRAFADMASQMAVEQLFGLLPKITGAAAGGGGGGAGATFEAMSIVGHTGGVIGKTPLPKRMVPSAIFSGAPRLHGGLAGDEFPAILQRGETVIPKGGGTTLNNEININIMANDASSFADMTNRNPGAIIGPIMKGIQEGNMPLINSIRGVV